MAQLRSAMLGSQFRVQGPGLGYRVQVYSVGIRVWGSRV